MIGFNVVVSSGSGYSADDYLSIGTIDPAIQDAVYRQLIGFIVGELGQDCCFAK
jgi:hypothetical protein